MSDHVKTAGQAAFRAFYGNDHAWEYASPLYRADCERAAEAVRAFILTETPEGATADLELALAAKDVCEDLLEMSRVSAIKLEGWPAARRLIAASTASWSLLPQSTHVRDTGSHRV